MYKDVNLLKSVLDIQKKLPCCLKYIVNPSNAKTAFVQITRMQHHLKPCHICIHWIALAEYFQMSTHMPGFQ